MSIIPSGAVNDAFIPVRRASHELLRARNAQLQKNVHHAEDVDELDDTAVNTVSDESHGRGKRDDQSDDENPSSEERVEIEALESAPVSPPPKKKPLSDEPPPAHLDISA